MNSPLTLFSTITTEGIKAYDLTDTENPIFITSHAGTFPAGNPGYPPLALPNNKSGFLPGDFAMYPPPFNSISIITNLPGVPPPGSPVPYPFVTLPFDSLIDGNYVYMQARTGVTYIFQIV